MAEEYGTRDWQFSGEEYEAREVTKRFTQTGLYPVIISNAQYFDKDTEGTYANSFQIEITGIEGETADAVASLRYWMTDNKTGQENWRTKNTLIGLGKALFGPDFKGIPHPDDMKERLCFAEVTVKPKEDGSPGFARVYHFTSIDDYYEVFATKPQYFRRKSAN